MKIKKLSKNLNESEMEEFIIDRSKSPRGIETQIGRTRTKSGTVVGENGFRKFEGLENRPLEGGDSVEAEPPPVINYNQEKRRKKLRHLGAKIDFSGEYSFCEYDTKQFGRK